MALTILADLFVRYPFRRSLLQILFRVLDRTTSTTVKTSTRCPVNPSKTVDVSVWYCVEKFSSDTGRGSYRTGTFGPLRSTAVVGIFTDTNLLGLSVQTQGSPKFKLKRLKIELSYSEYFVLYTLYIAHFLFSPSVFMLRRWFL